MTRTSFTPTRKTPGILLAVLMAAMAAGPVFNYGVGALSATIVESYAITEGQYGFIITATVDALEYAALLPPAQPTGEHSMAAIEFEACTPGTWQLLVIRDDVVAARSRLIAVKPLHDGTVRRRLLAGIALCEVCRKPMKSARPVNHPTPRKDGSVAPAQRYHGYRCHFSRKGDPIDKLVSEICIGRLAELDVVDLFASRNEEVDLAALHTRREALQAEYKNVFAAIGDSAMRLAAAQERLTVLEDDLREVDGLIAKAAQRHPLTDLMGVEDVREWWESRTLARQGAIVQFLMTIVIKPVGRGKWPRSTEDVLASLEITIRCR